MRAGVESNHQFKQSSGGKRKEFQKKEEKIQRYVHVSELLIATMIETAPWKLRNGDRETAEKESKSKKAREKVAKEIPKQTEKPKKKKRYAQ
jgi:hypothetical protein